MRITGWYFKNERHLSSLGIIAGFIFDVFTLTRVDHTLENIWIGLHLIVAAVGILFINLYEEGKLKEKFPGRAHFWWTFIIQFAFGGLFSVYLVFYTRSGSLNTSWPFLILLAITFIANERLRNEYSRLVFQISQLFFATLFYSIYVIPIIVGNISQKVFILSGIVSLILIFAFILFLAILTPLKVKKEKWQLWGSIAAIYLIINLLYFTDIIPPIPLSLKQAHVYHSITKNSEGYVVTGEEGPTDFFSYFLNHQSIHLVKGEPLYVWSAVFAPAKFNTGINHRWQYYDTSDNKWHTSSLIPLNIIGGRENGFRTYSIKTTLTPGKWRVRVETSEGQVVGHLNFTIEFVDRAVDLKTQII